MKELNDKESESAAGGIAYAKKRPDIRCERGCFVDGGAAKSYWACKECGTRVSLYKLGAIVCSHVENEYDYALDCSNCKNYSEELGACGL